MNKKELNEALSITIIVLMVLSFCLFFLAGLLDATPVQAVVGLVEDTFTANMSGMADNTDSGDYWSVLVSGSTAESYGASTSCGFSADTLTDKWDEVKRACAGWDISNANLSSTDGIVSITVRLYLITKSTNFTNGVKGGVGLHLFYDTPYLGWFGSVRGQDFDNMRPSVEICPTVGYDEMSDASWVEFDIDPDMFDNIVDIENQLVYVSICEALYDYHSAPAWQYGKEVWFTFASYSVAGSEPQLIIEYYGDLPDREATERDDGDYVAPDESAELYSCNWSTPRCAYSDEDINFEIYGEDGAIFEAELITNTGIVLDEVDDNVYDNGFRNVTFEVASTFEGLVRCRDVLSGIASEWGYIAISPDSSQEVNYIYSESTEYPQYYYPFTSYVVQTGDIMQVHWKTYMTSTDFPDVDLELWYLADNTTVVYDENFSDLVDNYYLNIDENDDAFIGWRYALFVMNDTGAGWDDRDGLLQNLSQTYGTSTSGFYQPVLTTSEGEQTTTHSAYWYLTDNGNDHVYCYVESYDENNMLMRVYAGNPSKVLTDLNDFRGSIVNSDGDTTFVFDWSLSSTETSFIVPIPLASGDYVVYFTFSNPDNSYEYIKAVNLTILEGEVSDGGDGDTGSIWDGGLDFTSWINSLLARYGLDNEGGHWLFILILCAIIALLFMRLPLVATVFVLLIFGWAIATGFVNPWVAVLLVLGMAGTVFVLFKRGFKMFGAGKDDDDDEE